MTDPQPTDPGQPPAGPITPPAPPTDPALAAALADAEKWKNLSRQHEARAKAHADKAIRFHQLEAAHAEALAKLTGERDTLTGEVGELRTDKMRRDAVREGRIVHRANMFGLMAVRKTRAEGVPAHLVAHEDVLIFKSTRNPSSS